MKVNNEYIKCILGLGNPGEQYRRTKHNIGFLIIDKFARINKLKFKPGRGNFFFVNTPTIKKILFLPNLQNI